MAAGIIANLGGHEAVAAALAVSWPDPTGEFAVLANVPHLLWQATIAGMISDAAASIEATGTAFETLKAATPTPLEIGENQIEHGVLQAHNFLGMLMPAIAANRANYGRMWVTAADNKYSYAAASAAGVQAIPPLAPPPPTTVGGEETRCQRWRNRPAETGRNRWPAAAALSAMSGIIGSLGQFGQFGNTAGRGGPLQSMRGCPSRRSARCNR